MVRSKATPYLLFLFLWGYLLSAVYAIGVWDKIYNKIILAFDLTSNQVWLLPLCFNLFVGAIAVFPILRYFVLVWKGSRFSHADHIVWAFCLLGCIVSLSGAIGVGIAKHKQITSAFGESVGSAVQNIFAAGNLEGRVYSNSAIGLCLKCPASWYPMSLKAIDRAKASGAQAVGGDVAEQQAKVGARKGVFPLLAIRKHPGSYNGYNPSLFLSAYDKNVLLKDGVADLAAYAKTYAIDQGPYHVQRGPIAAMVGELNGYYVHIETRNPQATINQHAYFAETPDLYILLVASIDDDADLVPLKDAISTLSVQHQK